MFYKCEQYFHWYPLYFYVIWTTTLNITLFDMIFVLFCKTMQCRNDSLIGSLRKVAYNCTNLTKIMIFSTDRETTSYWSTNIELPWYDKSCNMFSMWPWCLLAYGNNNTKFTGHLQYNVKYIIQRDWYFDSMASVTKILQLISPKMTPH